jgi:hypothetical protein
METPFLLFVAMKQNSTGVASVSMEVFNYGCLEMARVLYSNDGIQPTTSQYFGKSAENRNCEASRQSLARNGFANAFIARLHRSKQMHAMSQ